MYFIHCSVIRMGDYMVSKEYNGVFRMISPDLLHTSIKGGADA